MLKHLCHRYVPEVGYFVYIFSYACMCVLWLAAKQIRSLGLFAFLLMRSKSNSQPTYIHIIAASTSISLNFQVKPKRHVIKDLKKIREKQEKAKQDPNKGPFGEGKNPLFCFTDVYVLQNLFGGGN